MPSKTALLIDFDNVFISLWELDREAAFRFGSKPADWLQVLANTQLTGDPRKWLVAKCYLNPAAYVTSSNNRNDRLYFSQFRPSLVRAGLEVIDCPAVTRQGKNAADIRMVLDAVDLLNHRTRFDEFILASGDADFTPLLQRIRAEDRRITVVSPGYLAPAYTATADRVVNFDALAAILNGAAQESSEENLNMVEQRDAADPADDQTRFTNFVRRRYQDASGPLNLAALAAEASRLCPTAKQSDWFGNKSFSAALASLDLPHVRTSQHHMWDDERHQPPAGTAAASLSGWPKTVALFIRDMDLPAIEQKNWPKLFQVLSAYAANNQFDFTEITRCARDILANEHGVHIPRASISYVVSGCQFRGVRLDAEAAPTPGEIGQAFSLALLDRAASLGIQVSTEAEEAIRDWLGLGATPVISTAN